MRNYQFLALDALRQNLSVRLRFFWLSFSKWLDIIIVVVSAAVDEPLKFYGQTKPGLAE